MTDADLLAAVELAQAEPYPYRALVGFIREELAWCPMNKAIGLADKALGVVPAETVERVFRRRLINAND